MKRFEHHTTPSIIERGRIAKKLLHQMPVTNSFTPEGEEELNKKIRANVPGQEAQLLRDVKDHVRDKLSTVTSLLIICRLRVVLPFTSRVRMAQET